MINIIYYDLITLINSSNLVTGQSYRITDYVCTTTTTGSQAVNNLFDIVVTALDEGHLSENASAVQHEGDIYFENSRLESWKLKYCIDNDTNRFAWADNVNGKGVIYYMKDKWGNECPYDFKNIQYLKNSVWVYTFGGATDNSLIGECHHNKINLYISSNKQTLNNITFGNNCMNNTFGDDCYNITFGNDCYSNTFGSLCHSNTFGDDCYQNTFCDDCYLNIFGNNCTDNTFGNSCKSNTFDNYCQTNTFGDSGQTNTFGDYCNSNTFGTGCNNNTFGIDCNSNTFGDDCLYNNFYHGTSGTTKQDYLRYIVLEDGVSNNNFYSDVNTDIGNYLQRIRISGLENIDPTDTIITLSTTNTDYEWVVAKNSDEIIEQYYPEDSLKSDAPSDNKTYGRKNGNWSEIDTSGGGISIIPITWSDLKSLRDAGTLVPGQSYRITDYVCTTTTTDSQAVNNLFDIVVTALSANELSENASATYHEGDTYFSSNNATLESWELKYCIDNDTSRFAWADAVNGKGVIHYIKDNYNNEAPYDFKNIQYLKNGLWLYTFGGAIDNSVVAYYDNVLSVYLYNIDNIIGVYRSKVNQIFKSRLSFNTFGIDCESNTFGDNCYLNSFGDFCYSNTLGFFSGGNTFGDECSSNTFGSYCSSNTFGDSCNSNIFGSECSSNTFGNSCFSNTFGDKCISNTFGNGCYANTFGYDCNSNKFGDGCSSNTFGEDCNYNMFGNSCFSNNFGENCGYNTFGKNCQTNTFGKNCDSNTFGNRCSSNTFGNYCNSNNFYIGTSGTTKKDYIRYIVLEDGCINNNFYSNLTTSDNNYLQRIRIKGLANYSPTPIQITLSEENTNYEWVICYKSDGTLKQYCPAG